MFGERLRATTSRSPSELVPASHKYGTGVQKEEHPAQVIPDGVLCREVSARASRWSVRRSGSGVP